MCGEGEPHMSENKNPEFSEDVKKESRDLSELHDEFSQNVENVEEYTAEASEENPFEPISKKTSRVQPLPEERLSPREADAIKEAEEEEDEYEYYDDDESNGQFIETLKKLGIGLGALVALALLGVLLFLGLNSGRHTNNTTNPSLNPTINTPGPVTTESADPTSTADPSSGDTLVVDNVEETARPEGSIGDETSFELRDLVGMTVAEAKKYGKTFDLNIEVEEEQSSEREGILIKQNPEANSLVSVGDTVTVTVSIGGLDPIDDPNATAAPDENKTEDSEKKETTDSSNGNNGSNNTNTGTASSNKNGTYELKDMTGTSAATAASTLTANKIKYTTSECYSDKAAGTIISQSPKTGTIKEGTTVSMIVSRGPLAVLNFKGLEKKYFESYLNTLRDGCINASATYVEEETSEVPVGMIADVRVGDKTAIGTNAYDGEKFTVVIAKHPTVTLPDFVGVKYTDVKDWMFKNGVKIQTIEQYSTDVKSGIVISTDPAKTTIQKGKSVKVYVSKGTYSAYDFTGKPYGLLQTDINKAISEGAKVNVVTTYKPSATVAKDSIISQEQIGSTINVVISSGKNG